MDVARFLVRGVDVWLNNPRRPMEASGTSGMKAAANGVLNMSTLDGWWPEGYIPEALVLATSKRQNQTTKTYRAASDYTILENSGAAYNTATRHLPRAWIAKIKPHSGRAAFQHASHAAEYVRRSQPAAARYRYHAAEAMSRQGLLSLEIGFTSLSSASVTSLLVNR